MRPEKKLLLNEIKENIESSGTVIVTRYAKLPAKLSWDLSIALQKNEGFFEVVKKRVFIKAAKEAGIDFDVGEIKGHIGILFAKGDSLGAIKQIYEFSKSNEDIFDVVQGKFEDKIYSKNEIAVLANLPTKNEMRAEFLGLLVAPMSQTLSVMESLLTSLLYCIENKKKKQK